MLVMGLNGEFVPLCNQLVKGVQAASLLVLPRWLVGDSIWEVQAPHLHTSLVPWGSGPRSCKDLCHSLWWASELIRS